MGQARNPSPGRRSALGSCRDPIRLAPVPDASRPDRRRADDRRHGPGADRTGPCSPLRHDRRHLRRTSRLLGGHDRLHRRRRSAAGILGLPPPRRPLGHRHVLGRAADFQGIRGRDLPPGVDPRCHAYPLAGGEARSRRRRERGHRRASESHRELVVKQARLRDCGSVQPSSLRGPRRRADRLRRLRLRARAHRRADLPADAARDADRPRRLRRGPRSRLLPGCARTSLPRFIKACRSPPPLR